MSRPSAIVVRVSDPETARLLGALAIPDDALRGMTVEGLGAVAEANLLATDEAGNWWAWPIDRHLLAEMEGRR